MEVDIRRRFSTENEEGDRSEKLLTKMSEDIQVMTSSLARIELYMSTLPAGGSMSPEATMSTTRTSRVPQGSFNEHQLLAAGIAPSQLLPSLTGVPPTPTAQNGPGSPGAEPTFNLRTARSKTVGGGLGERSEAPTDAETPSRRKSTGSGYSSASAEKGHNLFERLGTSWPASVQIRSRLRGGHNQSSENSSRVSEALAIHALPSKGGALGKRGTMGSRRCKLPMDPNSMAMNVVDVVKFVVLLHDILVVPFILAWNVPPSQTLFVFESVAAFYWSIDFVLNFLVGFYFKGELQMAFKDIITHYFRTWFCLDIFLLSADYMTLGLSYPQVGERNPSGNVFQIVRSIRILKLLRLIRFGSVVNKLAEISKKASAAQMAKIPLSLVVYNHLMACAWGVIGRLAPTDVGLRWLDNEIGGPELSHGSEQAYKDLDPLQQYAAAMHWTLAQMTPGPIDIVSRSLLERTFNIFVLVVGLLFGSMIVSQFSGHIMRVTMLKRDRTQKIDTVRKFLRQREVPSKISLRVQKQVIQRLEEEVPLQVRDVQGFHLLSSTLRSELLHEVRLPHLLTHALFQMWARLDRPSVLNICEIAVEFAFLSPQDVLFNPLGEGQEAYAVISGTMLYTLDDELASEDADLSDPQALKTVLKKERWMCEVALWSHWHHVGKAEAQVASELLVISANGLMKELERDHFACQMMKHYGRSYHMRVTSAMPPFADWPTDVAVPYTEMSDLVGAEVSIGMLNNALASHQMMMTGSIKDELEQEIRDEKCALRTRSDGALERTVAVVALRLKDTDDTSRFLVEVGKADAHKPPKVSWSLPGHKRAMSEVPQNAIRRLLWKRFAPVKDLIVLEKTEHEVVKIESTAYGMMTTYQRSIYVGRCEEGYVHEELSWKLLLPSNDRPDRLSGYDIYVAEDAKSGFVLWGWIDTEAFEWGKSDAGAKVLQQWLPQVDKTQVAETLQLEGTRGLEASAEPNEREYVQPRREGRTLTVAPGSRVQVNMSPDIMPEEPADSYYRDVEEVRVELSNTSTASEIPPAQMFELQC